MPASTVKDCPPEPTVHPLVTALASQSSYVTEALRQTYGSGASNHLHSVGGFATGTYIAPIELTKEVSERGECPTARKGI